jgi:ATP-binding cassette subfamily F protein 3
MVLDEPTNHLDLPSCQFLEEVLREFAGTLLFVSHDRYFIDSLATSVWAIEDGILRPYPGSYTEYRTCKPPSLLEVTERAQPIAPSERAKSKKGAREKVRTLEDVEHDLEKAEAQVLSLENALAQAGLHADAAQLTLLSVDYEQAKAQVDKLFAEWEQLADGAAS